MSSTRRALGRALVAAAAADGSRAWAALAERVGRVDLAELHRAAMDHRLNNVVYHALLALGTVDADALDPFEREYQHSLRGHLRALTDLGAVEATLAEAGVPWVVVKGPVLSEVAYRAAGPRNYADLDVVVPRGAFRTAVRACLDAGRPVVETDWATATAELAGEVCVLLPNGTALDLHWDLQYHATSRARFATSVDAMIERSVAVDLAGTSVRTFDPADTLLHLALHAASGGGGRLQWLKDIERCITSYPPDWDALVERAGASRLAVVVGVMLDRTHDVLGVEVPREASAALGGRSWRQVVRATNRLRPIQETSGRRALSTMVVRSTAATSGASVLALGRQVRNATRSGVEKPSRLDLRTTTGADLERFLDAVSGAGPSSASPTSTTGIAR